MVRLWLLFETSCQLQLLLSLLQQLFQLSRCCLKRQAASCSSYGRSWRGFSCNQMWLLLETSYRYYFCSRGCSNDKLLAALATAAAAHRDKLPAVVRYCSYGSFQRQIVIHSRSNNQHPGQLTNDSSKLQLPAKPTSADYFTSCASQVPCCEATATCCSTNHDSSDLELNLLL
jgi:hypothetical protein